MQSPTSKKYLGEPNDPHFIPDSPLIGRQVLTEQEEDELKRMCALVLADVQHSDDMSDDPLKYIAAHIQVGRSVQERHADRDRTSQPARDTGATSTKVKHKLSDLKTDLETPSEGSRRYTSTTTDNSTPLTSAGLTPGEPGPRLSDAARRSTTGSNKLRSSLRNEASARTKSRTTSNAGLHRSLEKGESILEVESVGRTLRLVKNTPSRPRSSHNKSMEMDRSARQSAPDLNKSLPAPPQPDSPDMEDSKQPHISMLMKSIRKKSMTSECRNASTVSAPPLSSAEQARSAAAVQLRTRAATATGTTANGNQPPEPPKKRFRFRLFPRAHRPANLLVT